MSQMVDADNWYKKYAGQSLSFDGIEANRGQCVQTIEYVLTDKQYGYGLQPFWGNAIDWWNNYGGSLLAFDKLTDGTIKKGDIVIFNQNVGSVYGHIDMAMSDGTYNQFTGADSNWAANKTVHLVNHVGSQYILGVLRLKGDTMNDNVTQADLDILRIIGACIEGFDFNDTINLHKNDQVLLTNLVGAPLRKVIRDMFFNATSQAYQAKVQQALSSDAQKKLDQIKAIVG